MNTEPKSSTKECHEGTKAKEVSRICSLIPLTRSNSPPSLFLAYLSIQASHPLIEAVYMSNVMFLKVRTVARSFAGAKRPPSAMFIQGCEGGGTFKHKPTEAVSLTPTAIAPHRRQNRKKKKINSSEDDTGPPTIYKLKGGSGSASVAVDLMLGRSDTGHFRSVRSALVPSLPKHRRSVERGFATRAPIACPGGHQVSAGRKTLRGEQQWPRISLDGK